MKEKYICIDREARWKQKNQNQTNFPLAAMSKQYIKHEDNTNSKEKSKEKQNKSCESKQLTESL